MGLRGRIADWLLAEGQTPVPPQGEEAAGSASAASQFRNTDARIGTYAPSKVSFAKMDEMETHYQVAAACDLIALPLLNASFSVEGDPLIAGYVYEVTKPVWVNFVRSCAVGVLKGCAPHELVYQRADTEVIDEANDIAQVVSGWRPAKIKDLDPKNLKSILVDGYENFAGYDYLYPAGTILEPERCVHFAYDRRYGNWWGRGRLARVYDPWYRFQVVWDQWIRYLDRFATPPTIVYFPPGETAGTKHSDAAMSLGENFTGDETHFALPLSQKDDSGEYYKSWDIDLLRDNGRAQQFMQALDFHGRAIFRAALIPDTVFTQQAQTGSLALSQTHESVYLDGEDAILKEIIRTYNAQVIPRIVRYTFGEGQPIPVLTSAGLTDTSKALFIELFKAATASGFAPVAWDRIAERLDVPLDEDEAGGTEEGDEEAGELSAVVRREIAMLAEKARNVRLALS